MKNIVNILVCLLENPNSKKTYKQLAQSFLELNRKEEAEAFEYLIQQRFHVNYIDHSKQTK